MPQYQEGQRLRGPNGEIGEVRNGQIVVVSAGDAVVTRPADPRLPAQTRQAQAGAQRDEYVAEAQPRRDRFSDENTLRQQFNGLPEVQRYREVVPIYISARNAANTRAGDLNLTYAFGKVMDPGSVVREAEQVMVQGTSPIADRVRALISEVDRSGRLRPETRRQLMDELRSRRIQLAQAYAQARNQYSAVAQEYGFNPDRIVGEHPATPYAEEERRARVVGASTEGAQEVPASWTPEQRAQIQEYATRARSPEDLDAFALRLSGGRYGIENPREVVEHFRATGQLGPVSDAMPQPSAYQNSPLGQTLSGVNEGVAGALGAPVDLVTGALNLGLQGAGAATGSDLGQIEAPFGGSERWRSIMTGAGAINPVTNDPSTNFLRRIGQSTGAAAVPIAGTYSSLGRAGAGLLTAAGGGAGAAAANQAFPGNPLAELGGEVLGSVGTGVGMFGAAGRSARRTAEAAVPSAQDLRNQASGLYRAAEERGVVGGPNVTANMAGRIGDIARRNELVDPAGTVSDLYPQAREALNVTGRYSGQPINPTQIQVIREGLADAVQGTEGRQRRIARDMLNAFDEETAPLAPELSDARRTASRYLQADTINRARDLAEARAGQFSQAGTENALRTEFRNLDRQVTRGDAQFNPAVTEAIQNTARGTPWSNAMRNLGRLAPSTPFASVPGLGAGAGIGALAGDPMIGAAATGSLWGGGMVGRYLANRATNRNAELAELLARNGGPLEVQSLIDPELLRQFGLASGAQVANAGY